MTLSYLIDLTHDDNDTFLVTCPALPEVTTFGGTEEEVRRSALGAIEEAIAARISGGDPLPAPVPASERTPRRHSMFIKLPTMTALKVELYLEARKTRTRRADLARRLGWHREQVDRLFRLDHASRLDQIEAAFRALEREIDVGITKIVRARIPANLARSVPARRRGAAKRGRV
jgi:antitoxin HicB